MSDVNLVLDEANLNFRQEGVCLDLPNIARLNVLLTLACNARCAHCITRSTPARTETLRDDVLAELLAEGARSGKRFVSYTGGEPFLDVGRVVALVAEAKRLGYVVAADTNAFWGVTREKADAVTARLVDAGLDVLCPSADAYHLPYVPLDRVVNVVAAADAAGLPCEVNFAPGADAELNEHIVATLRLRDRGFFSDGLSLTGNDVSEFRDCFPTFAPAEMDDTGSMYLTVDAEGRAIANADVSDTGAEFVGTPFHLGSVYTQSPRAVLDAERADPVLAVTRNAGAGEVDARLRADPATAAGYARAVEGKRFYTPTEFFLWLFAEPDAGSFTAALAEWGATIQEPGP